MKLINKRKIEKQTSYDIEVKDTHCFFANGILAHNSNGSVCYNSISGLWVQSREKIISVNSDNAGFAFFVEKHKEYFLDLFIKITEKYSIDLSKNTIVIYGEWAGKGIQKGMGINHLDKFFAIFGIKIAPFDKNLNSYWVNEKGFSNPKHRIFNINDFETFEVEIDFNNPSESYKKIQDLVDYVENNSPFAKSFGVEGIGEGIVFKFEYNGRIYRFKAKGEKHVKTNTKVREPKKVDNEKLQKINDVAVKVSPVWRLEQMYNEVMDTLNGKKGDIKKTGDFLKAVVQDIHKEDLDIIIESDLEPKEVNGTISKIAREWLFDRLNEEAGI